MNHAERLQKIESYGRAYELLLAALARFPTEMWQFRPAPGEWSIHELVVHISDSEANSYVRCRRFIAEPGGPVMAYDEAGWAAALDYQSQSLRGALELFRWLRSQSYALIKSLPESTWANTIYHPESGVMSFDTWLDIYERHIPEHVAQMEANYQAWLAR